MISRDALYSFIESLITDAAPDTPLEDAESFRSLRGSVNEAVKVVRVDCFSGIFNVGEAKLSERDVDFVIEFFVTPSEATEDADALAQLDAAKDLSFEMARTVFNEMATKQGWATICDAFGNEFDTATANLGGKERGATYFYGKVNG